MFYRINVRSKEFEIDYWKNFKAMWDYTGLILQVKKLVESEATCLGCWWFFEPYIEITWEDIGGEKSNLETFEKIKKIFRFVDCEYEFIPDAPPDWFCESATERQFGAERHKFSAALAEQFYKYNMAIKNGKGIEEQVKRTIHTICNPLAINYIGEAKICFSRGLICLLFRFFSHQKAVWIYRKIFRQKY